MESFFKISVLLLLSLTWTTKTNCYNTCFAAPEEEAIEVAAKEQCEQKEMDGFWLTKILMVEE